ncbi:MAG: hypothetical protein V4671_21300 [Armatimonadota bacterium]
MLYETLLLIGAVGLLAQTVLGMASHGHNGHGHGAHHHGGHHHAHGIDFDIPHGSPGHSGASGHGQGEGQAHGHNHGDLTVQHRASTALWTLLSPLTLFSLCLGAGATGVLTRPYLRMPLLVAVAALIGGFLFYSLLVKPLWRLIFQFASKPAETLSGVVAREAVAMGRFDANGQGIVRVTVDGEFVRLLARLESEDKDKGVAVSSGDKLVVTSVDEKRNTCRVTRI